MTPEQFKAARGLNHREFVPYLKEALDEIESLQGLCERISVQNKTLNKELASTKQRNKRLSKIIARDGK